MKKLRLIGVAVLVAAFGGLSACQSAPAPTRDGSDAAQAINERVVGEYQLGAGDQLRVTVFGEAELSGEYVLDGTGVVSMPLIGDVTALNLTVREFQRALEQRFADGYLRNPRVSAEVLNYRPFYILGEVRQPGEYPYTNGLTVLNAIATAGGFTYRANDNVVMIKRADDSQEYRVRLEPTTKILPGDTIRIVERFF
ncbi:MAG: polysaccharide export protein [Henriciella sp.]|nr:polysaccharide export protein [Henriciella sp.]